MGRVQGCHGTCTGLYRAIGSMATGLLVAWLEKYQCLKIMENVSGSRSKERVSGPRNGSRVQGTGGPGSKVSMVHGPRSRVQGVNGPWSKVQGPGSKGQV